LPNDILAIASLKYIVQFGAELEKAEASPVAEVATTPIRRNVLPDVYPEPKTPKTN
jgi:hypothetical protein